MDGPTPSAYTCSLPPTAPQCRVPADGSPGADSCCEEAGSPGAPTAEDVCLQSPISQSPLLDRLSTGGDRTGVEKGAVARARASLWGEPAAAEAEAPPPRARSEMEDEVPPMSPHVTMRSPQRRQRMVQTFEAEPAAAPPTAPAATPPLRQGRSGFQMAGFLSPAEAEAKAAAMAAAEADAAAEAESKVALEAESRRWRRRSGRRTLTRRRRRRSRAAGPSRAPSSSPAPPSPPSSPRGPTTRAARRRRRRRRRARAPRRRWRVGARARAALSARARIGGRRAGAARSRAPGSEIRGLWGRLAARA